MCASYYCRPLSPFCVYRVFLGPSPTAAESLFYQQIIYPISRFVKTSRRSNGRLTTQVYTLVVFVTKTKKSRASALLWLDTPENRTTPGETAVRARHDGLSPRFRPGSRAELVDSTPGLGMDEPADSIRMGAAPIGIARGRIGGPGPRRSISTRPIRPDDRAGRPARGRHDRVASWGLRRCSPMGDATRPAPSPIGPAVAGTRTARPRPDRHRAAGRRSDAGRDRSRDG